MLNTFLSSTAGVVEMSWSRFIPHRDSECTRGTLDQWEGASRVPRRGIEVVVYIPGANTSKRGSLRVLWIGRDLRDHILI